MGTSFLFALVEVSAVSSAAILVVAAMRKWMRRVVGARAAYWLWLLVPVSVFVLFLPAPERPLNFISAGLPELTGNSLTLVSAVRSSGSIDYGTVTLLVWVAGALIMLALIARRQRAFIRSLGTMTPGANETLRSADIAGPMLVGVWRPQIILPSNFESRYEVEEQTLVLAHEQAHRQRGDALVNGLAAGALCVSWFNPLVYLAIEWMRTDQELACDEVVLSRFAKSRRQYADALLKTQLASDLPRRIPVGCHWRSDHPLKERIAMLKRPLPGIARRSFGVLSTLALVGSASYSVWAMQPAEPAEATLSENSSSYSVTSDYMSTASDGDVMLSGNVTLKPLGDAPLAKITSLSTLQDISTGLTVLEGDVAIAIDDHIFTTDRATVTADGTITMAAARSSKLSSSGSDRSRPDAGSQGEYRPAPGTLGEEGPALISAVDLAKWFPADAASAGIEGDVQITVTLDDAARPIGTRIESESPQGYGFAAAASTAAHFFKYRNPTGAQTSLTFNIRFALSPDAKASTL